MGCAAVGQGWQGKASPEWRHWVPGIRKRAWRLSLPAAEQLAGQEKVICQRGTLEQGSGMWFIQGVAGTGPAQGCRTPSPVHCAPAAGLVLLTNKKIHSASLPFLLILCDKIDVHGQCRSTATLLHPHQVRDTKFTGEKGSVYVDLRAALGSSFSGPDHMTFFTI